METDLALAKTKADRIVAVDAHNKRLRQLKKSTDALFRAREASQEDVLVVAYHLLQADRLMLLTKSVVSSTN